MFRRSSAALLLALLAAASCSPGDDEATAPSTTSGGAGPGASTTTPPSARVDLTFPPVETGGTPPPPDAVVAAVQGTLRRYLADAVVSPLVSGRPAPDLSALFFPAALERVNGADRPTLVEEGLPPANRGVTADMATAALSSLAGPDGATALVAARLDVRLHALGDGLDVDVVRQGDLVLADDGAGTWRIEAFQVRTTRDSRP